MKNKLVFSVFAVMLFASCSTAPKRPVEIFTLLNMTETQLDLVNRAADRGNYTMALDLLVEAKRLAVSTDRPKLLIRAWLSEGNVYYYLNRSAEADMVWKAGP